MTIKRRSALIVLLGAVFCLVASQAALAPSIGVWLRRGLEKQASSHRSLDVKVAPLGWWSLIRGRLSGVEIKAGQISFGGVRLDSMQVDLREIRFNPFGLLRGGTARISALGPSRIQARVTDAALNDYRRTAYPEVPAIFHIGSGQIGVTGSLNLLGRKVAVNATGWLHAIQGDRLRFVPRNFEVAGRKLPSQWLSTYGEQLALEFPLAIPLPLPLREVNLGNGFLDLVWTNR